MPHCASNIYLHMYVCTNYLRKIMLLNILTAKKANKAYTVNEIQLKTKIKTDYWAASKLTNQIHMFYACLLSRCSALSSMLSTYTLKMNSRHSDAPQLFCYSHIVTNKKRSQMNKRHYAYEYLIVLISRIRI